MTGYLFKAIAACVVIGALVPVVVRAQESPPMPSLSAGQGAEIEVIVVTAQKRQERLSDVGMSVTAVSAAALERRGITQVPDLAKVEPSLQFAESNNGTPIYAIRGVGYYEQSLAATPTVSVYQDEVPYTYPVMTKGALLDPDRVEILKGPQGTLYGQNATGGAIDFIAARPTDSFTAGANATYSGFGEANLDGFVSGPVTGRLLARLAAGSDEGGAWQKSDTDGAPLGNKDTRTGRLILDWTPNDNFRASLNINGWTDHSDTQAGQLEGIRFLDPQYVSVGGSFLPAQPYSQYPTQIQALLANRPAPTNDLAADWVTGTRPNNNEGYYQASLRLEDTVSEAISFTSLSNYERYTQADTHDIAGTDVVNIGGLLVGSVQSVSQELRAHGAFDDKKAEWLFGLNYAFDKTQEYDNLNQYFTTASYLTGGSPESILPLAPFTQFGAINDVFTTTKSVFADFEYHFLPDISAHAGIRYTQSDQRIAGCALANSPDVSDFLDVVEGLLRPGLPLVPAVPGQCETFGPTATPGVQDTSLNQSNVPWRVGIDWKPAKEDLFYFTISKGFKAGSSPALSATSYLQLKPVTQESVLAYELGVKSQFLDRHLSVSGALFHYDYRNKQMLGRIIDPLGVFGALQALVNIPDSEEDGAEMSLTWLPAPLPALTLSTSATYLDSRVTSDFVNYASYVTSATDTVNFKGEAFPYTPKWSLRYGGRYDWQVNGHWAAFVGADASFQTSTTGAFGAQHADAEGPALNIGAYGLLDMSAGIESSDGRWQFEIWGENILNKYYWTSVYYESDTTVRLAGMPATYGVTIRCRI